MTTVQELRQRLERKKGRRDQLMSEIGQIRKEIRSLKVGYVISQKAGTMIQKVANDTQKQLQYQLSELPRLALQGVFNEPDDFLVEFEIRAGRPEADFWFGKGECKIDPKHNSGLGQVDIAGVSLRPSLWSLQRPRNRAILFLDEPFKHLKGVEPNIRALQMLQEICKPKSKKNWPGMQIIMIADERAPREELIQVADKMWEFSMKNKTTIVKEI